MSQLKWWSFLEPAAEMIVMITITILIIIYNNNNNNITITIITTSLLISFLNNNEFLQYIDKKDAKKLQSIICLKNYYV